MSPEDKQILIESLRSKRDPNPNPPDHAIRLLEETCERLKIDWKLRHVYLINRGGKWRVEVSIDGFRHVADNSPEYAGQEGPFWTLLPEDKGGKWTDIPPDTAPYAAKVGAVKIKEGGVKTTSWGVVKFKDYDPGTDMWRKFSGTMIAKCAEMLALRKAFPGKLGGLYGAEEMAQADKGDAAPKSRRSSTPTKTDPEVVFPEPEDQTNADWEEQIRACKTVAELKKLGSLISETHMGREAKLALSVVYNNWKAELEKKNA